MKIRLLQTLFLGLGIVSSVSAQRNCGAVDQLNNLIQKYPEMQAERQKIESHTDEFIKNYRQDKVTGVVYTIPVVVHIVFNGTAQNLSDAQVQSQIDVLNEDFRLLNADNVNTPSFFAGLKSDVEVQFCLAKKDPNGAVSTGITRTTTTTTSFGTNDAVKSASTGGKAAWNTAAYLNLWVCNIGGGILGYAQFPGGPGSTDGVVIDYRYLGRGGSSVAPFNKGRTGTHEVGHWLNLNHIWGDDGTSCSGTDNVADTPNQADENYGCPGYPTSSCNNTSDMYMNYMDYTDDACMFMFSSGQTSRMRALFATGGARASLLTSTGCQTGTVTTCAIPVSLTTTSVTQTTVNLNWGAAGGAVSYNLQLLNSGGTILNTFNTSLTTYPLTGLIAGTNYLFRIQTVCAAGSSVYSSNGSFSTQSSGIVAYCVSKGNNQADEWIDRVSLSNLLRTSAADAGYVYFTSNSANISVGTTYSLGYSAGFRSGYKATQFWKVWIDWNKDGDFADAGEQIVSRSSTSANNLSTSFTVPATALKGTTRMRVSMKWNSANTSCETFSYGEVEDYNVVVSGGSAKQIAKFETKEEDLSELQVYPNPANDRLQLEMPNLAWFENATVLVVDMQGKTWKNEILTSPNNDLERAELKVENLPNGLYNLIIFSEKSKISKKVLILHP